MLCCAAIRAKWLAYCSLLLISIISIMSLLTVDQETDPVPPGLTFCNLLPDDNSWLWMWLQTIVAVVPQPCCVQIIVPHIRNWTSLAHSQRFWLPANTSCGSVLPRNTFFVVSAKKLLGQHWRCAGPRWHWQTDNYEPTALTSLAVPEKRENYEAHAVDQNKWPPNDLQREI